MLLVALLGLVAGSVFRGWIAARPRAALALYAAVWAAVYTVYVIRIGL
jgi:hypothetical protein